MIALANSVKVDEHPCPHCGVGLDHVTMADGEKNGPKPGDISICQVCGEITRFTETLSYRPLVVEDADDLAHHTNPEHLAFILRMSDLLRARYNARKEPGVTVRVYGVRL
jgi:hypothetical protein